MDTQVRAVLLLLLLVECSNQSIITFAAGVKKERYSSAKHCVHRIMIIRMHGSLCIAYSGLNRRPTCGEAGIANPVEQTA